MSGVISAGDAQTAAAGADILRVGGNAVDAAVAAAFASFIAEIGIVHLGGSGLAHIYNPADDSSVVYDFFSNAPGLGTPQPAALDFRQVTIDYGATTQDFFLGRASVAVSGNIEGLCRLAADHGRLPLATVMAPALKLAREGALLSRFQAETCQLLSPIYTHTEEMRQIFAADGVMIAAGQRLFLPGLAETLSKIVSHGPSWARDGELGRAMVADQAARGGLLTEADLHHYQVYALPSIRIQYREFEILLPPPCSTGGVLTAFALKLLSAFDLSKIGYGSAAHMQILYEVMAAATRARPGWAEIQSSHEPAEAIALFLGEPFLDDYRQQVKVNLSRGEASTAMPEPDGPNDTSHLSVIDGDGLAVSMTTTAGESAGYVLPGTGYIPNNIMGEADLHPNGFHSHPAGQRIPTMMTPTVVLKNGKTRLVVGSGGSIRIRSAILQVLSNLLDFGMTLDQAVNNPRVHIENGVLQCEPGLPDDTILALQSKGYPVNLWEKRSIYFGGAHSVSRTEKGRLVAAGDSRRGGSVASA